MASFDKLHLYDAADLTASHMYQYQPGTCKAIVLACMGYAVPNFPDMLTHESFVRACARNKGRMFVVSDLLPTNKMTGTGKAYLQKEIICHHIANQRDSNSIPKVKNWSITHFIDHLKAISPPLQVHGFIVAMVQSLIEEIKSSLCRTCWYR